MMIESTALVMSLKFQVIFFDPPGPWPYRWSLIILSHVMSVLTSRKQKHATAHATTLHGGQVGHVEVFPTC